MSSLETKCLLTGYADDDDLHAERAEPDHRTGQNGGNRCPDRKFILTFVTKQITPLGLQRDVSELPLFLLLYPSFALNNRTVWVVGCLCFLFWRYFLILYCAKTSPNKDMGAIRKIDFSMLEQAIS